jgi:alcohol dehydrogenase (cytochrome c)
METRLRLRTRGIAIGFGATAAALAGVAHAQGFFAGAPAPAFTADQAATGKKAYEDNCASCHGGGLDDGEFGPALKGSVFQRRWGVQTPDALLDYIRTRMPPAGPGTLPAPSYAAIEAYILQTNGVAAAHGAVRTSSPAPTTAQPPQPTIDRDAVPQPANAGAFRDAAYNAALARRKARLDALTPVTDATLAHPADGEWLMWRRTFETQSFSPLAQIDKANVHDLRTAWAWSLPVSQNEITPLVHDGVMFVESGAAVQALDAASGELLWQYVRAVDEPTIRASRVKALALYRDKLYVPTPDGHLIALDAKTGKLVWDHEIISAALADRHGGADGVPLHLDGGPIVAHGKVIMGVSLGITNAKGGCFIVGLDAQTGEEIWRFNTVDQSAVGKDSWNGAPVEERFGAGVWTAGSYDPDLNLVYFGTGNTYSAATLLQPHAQKGASNDGLYTDSTVALDADTGKLKWHYQHVNRDVWDLDWVFEQTLVTLPVDGKPRKLVVTAGKIALFDAMDRATGQYLFSHDVGLQNLVVAIDPKTGRKTTNPAVEPEPGVAKFLCPGGSGARSWPTSAFNPRTKIIYLPMIESCSDYTWAPRSAAETAAGGIDMRFGVRPRPNSDGNMGRIEAINLETRKVVWTRRQRAPVASSMLATAGGLVFNGAIDRSFSAYDEATGKVLWQTRLNASPSSSPITYSVDGQQYIAIVSGGGGAFDAGGRGLAPEIDNPAGGTTVVVYRLPVSP